MIMKPKKEVKIYLVKEKAKFSQIIYLGAGALLIMIDLPWKSNDLFLEDNIASSRREKKLNSYLFSILIVIIGYE